jgi:hypothetical protein
MIHNGVIGGGVISALEDGAVFLAYLLSGLPASSVRMENISSATIIYDELRFYVNFSINYNMQNVATKIVPILCDSNRLFVGKIKDVAYLFKTIEITKSLLDDINKNYPTINQIKNARNLINMLSTEQLNNITKMKIVNTIHQTMHALETVLIKDDLQYLTEILLKDELTTQIKKILGSNNSSLANSEFQSILNVCINDLSLYLIHSKQFNNNMIIHQSNKPSLIFSSNGLEIIDPANQSHTTLSHKKIYSYLKSFIYIENIELRRKFDRILLTADNHNTDLHKLYTNLIEKYSEWRSNIINIYPGFHDLKIPQRGRNHRVTYCWRCHENGLDNAYDLECSHCGWIICPNCHACDPNCVSLPPEFMIHTWNKPVYIKYTPRFETHSKFSDIFDDEIPF